MPTGPYRWGGIGLQCLRQQFVVDVAEVRGRLQVAVVSPRLAYVGAEGDRRPRCDGYPAAGSHSTGRTQNVEVGRTRLAMSTNV